MKHVFSVLLFFLIAISSFAQFNDTAALNAYIRDTIRDRRPDRVTAAQLQKGLLGIVKFIPVNTPLSNGLVGYGNSSNILTGKSAFTFDATTNALHVDSLLAKRVKMANSFVNTDIGNDGILSLGTYGSGSTLTPGSSSMMMWYPKRAAFRVGYISGTLWNDGNVGNYSAAFGQDTKASGVYSSAFGYSNFASDTATFVAGYTNRSKFKYQTVFGKFNDTTAQSAFAIGWGTANNARKNLFTIDTLGQSNYYVTYTNNVLARWYNESGYERITLSTDQNGGLYLGSASGTNVTGQFNLGIGNGVMEGALTGNDNTGIGGFTLTAATTGSYNTAVGYLGLYHLTSGLLNTAVGFQAGSGLTTGNGITAVGGYALRLATGSGNTALGYGTGYNLSTGGTNTLIGYQTGYNLGTGAGNVFLGYNAGSNASGNNQLYIANSNTATPLIYGEFDNSILALSAASGKFGIRTKTPQEALHVVGRLRIDTIPTGSNTDSVLTTVNGLVKKVASGDLSAYTFSTGLTNASGTITNNLLTGLSGGQTVTGGTAGGENLTLSSTTNATKGKILLGASAYDEVNDQLGIGVTTPSAAVHLKAGTATANTAPLKFTSGTLLTTPEAGAVEYDGTGYYFTDASGVRHNIAQTDRVFKIYPGDYHTDTTDYEMYGWNTQYVSDPTYAPSIVATIDVEITVTGGTPAGTVISAIFEGQTVYTLTVTETTLTDYYVIGTIKLNQDIKYTQIFYIKGAAETLDGAGVITSSNTAYRFDSDGFTNPTIEFGTTSSSLARIGCTYTVDKKQQGRWIYYPGPGGGATTF